MTAFRCACITNSVVKNVIESDLEYANTLGYDLVIVSNTAGVGDTYSDGVFIRKEGTSIIVPPVAPKNYWISVGAFFDRFGTTKYAILASTDPTVKALVLNCSVRTYIDLESPDVALGLGLLVQAGFDIDPTVVGSKEISEYEYPRLKG